MESRLCLSDLTFGPAVRNCRGGFDFTLKFEDIVLSLVPSSLFVILAIVRLWYLHGTKSVSEGSSLRIVKLIVATVYSALQLSILIKAVQLDHKIQLSTAARSLAFISSSFILPLTVLEDTRSQRPSFLLSLYLFFTTLLDIVQVRTRWLVSNEPDQIVLAKLYTAAVVAKFVLLILEQSGKPTQLGRSPEETSGPLGIATYTWLNSLFQKGYNNILSLRDLPSLDMHMSSQALHDRLSTHLSSTGPAQSTSRHSLAKALARTLLGPLLLSIIPRLALVGFRFSQPLLLNSLLNHLEVRADEEPSWRNAGYGIIGATVFIYLGIALSTALYWYCHERFVSMTRGALVAVIYEKLTQLCALDVNDSVAVTLMSTDIERIRLGLLNLHEFWASCVEVALASWLLYTQLGIAFVAPLIVVIVAVACASVVNLYTGSRQRRWMERIQVRVAETAHMLSNLKQLKISGLARPVEESTQQLRVEELDAASGFRRLYVSNMAFGFAPMALCPLITFAVTARTLDTSTIFTSLAYIVLLADPLGILFGEIPYLLTAFTCLERIQTFLSHKAQADCRRFESSSSSFSSSEVGPKLLKNPLIIVDKARIGWAENMIVFQDASIHIPASSLTMLIGPVGSGKSTLCRAFIAEVPILEGTLRINTAAHQFKSALCEQSPYIYHGSLRDNIIGSLSFDKAKYEEVINASLLDADFNSLPQGDATIVGSNGIALSGGQKQRVAIARALYHDGGFYVFDDSLSGLDADTELEVFNRVFGPDGILQRRRATVVLATHSVKHLSQATHIISLGTRGTVEYEGDYRGHAAMHQLSQKWHDYGTQDQELKEYSSKNENRSGKYAEEVAITSDVKTYDSFLSEKDRMSGDSTVYRYYLASLGKLSIAAFVVFGLGWGFFYNFGHIWLKFWSDDTSHRHSRAFYIGLYAVWQTGGLASIVLCFWTSYTMMVRISGAVLHQTALQTIVHAPLRFITTTDIGIITNLFSQDMTLIDNELPMAVTNLALDVANALGMAAVIATSSPYIAALYPFLAVILYFLQKMYLRTARQLRLLDLEAKSPLYSQFLDTSRGLVTIRAFNWTKNRITATIDLLDSSQKPAYLLAMAQRWLYFNLQCIVAVIAVVVVTLATQLNSPTAGFTGPSIVALMSFGDILNYIIRWWTQMETCVGAVTRLKTLSDKVLPEENGDDTSSTLPSDWPSKGCIEIRNVSASYHEPDTKGEVSVLMAEKSVDLVLDSISISIAAGQKVAVCGRSGSGKSSLILLLLRMLDPLPQCSKNIVIDDIGLHSVGREDTRNRIIAMSQDPVFLPGQLSVKKQLDPFGLSTEAECHAVLELVGLGIITTDLAGLEAILQPESLSGGQRQLFNLARTVLRGRTRSRDFNTSIDSSGKRENMGGILLLDEVSSSVDRETERTMQRVIFEEFATYTIVMVAHHLDIVMEYDRVIVMEYGRIAEQGGPKTLIEQEGSYFSQLWMASQSH